MEALLYRSKYYDVSKQSLMLSLIDNDDRPFVLSTPRLEADTDVHLKVALCPLRESTVCFSCGLCRVPSVRSKRCWASRIGMTIYFAGF